MAGMRAGGWWARQGPSRMRDVLADRSVSPALKLSCVFPP